MRELSVKYETEVLEIVYDEAEVTQTRQKHRKRLALYDPSQETVDPIPERSGVVVVPPCKPIPVYKYYVSINENWRTEDSSEFKFFPYTGDTPDETWQDKELRPLFDRDRTPDDDLTYVQDRVFTELLELYGKEPGCDLLFRIAGAVWRKSPEVIKEWRDNYHPLEAPFVASSSYEVTSNNAQLFCQHCGEYCCSLHDEHCLTLMPPRLARRPLVPPASAPPCGPACWRVATNFSSAVVIILDSDTDGGDEQSAHWTTEETFLYPRLRRVIGPNYCAIAALLGSKTCAEVAKYAKTAAALAEDVDPPPRLSTAQLKHAKQRQRTVAMERVKRMKEVLDQGNWMPRAYVPCQHAGPCTSDSCGCWKNDGWCDKWCLCPPDCPNRFPGCNCSAKTNCCIKESVCLCWGALRECDPELCRPCGAYKPKSVPQSDRRCRNVSMQNKYHKICFIGESKLHGNGLFIGESAQRDDFIYEYTGELISQNESNRRGTLYDKLQHSFLFNHTKEFVVDSMHKGNRTKFANHSPDPNLVTRTMYFGGRYSIGFWAAENISPGEELFLNYNYAEEHQKFVAITPSSPETKKRGKGKKGKVKSKS